jgi:hypothetical protein
MVKQFSTVLLGLLLASGAIAQSADYVVKIQPGVTPRMSPSGVAAHVLAAARRVHAEEGSEPTVVSVECDDGVEYRSHFTHPERRNGGPIWTVRLTGRFVNHHTGPGARSVTVNSASYVIDDETGEVMGHGMSDGGRGLDPNRLTKGR